MDGDYWLDLIGTTLVIYVIALICAQFSRPFFSSPRSKLISQIIASLLLFIAFIFSSALRKFALNQNSEEVSKEIIIVYVSIFLLKGVGMYLISCYAKSVGKSRFWSFIGLLNFALALPIMAFSLWQKSDQKKAN